MEQLESLQRLPVRAWESGEALQTALDHWRQSRGLSAISLMTPDGEGDWRCLASSPVGDIVPGPSKQCETVAGTKSVRLAEDCLLVFRAPEAVARPLDSAAIDSLMLLSAARLCLAHQRLEEQIFQESYKVVTLEALYDVGLAVAATLELEELYEEILLRAVSLLDARRGALYLLGGDEYRLQGTIGGDARERVPSSQIEASNLSSTCEEAGLLPGARHTLAVAMKTDQAGAGLLVVGDKESRTGVGAFGEGDQRAAALFATQAAIALENARLHREALEKQRLEREMELAAEIQRGILPSHMPSAANFETLGWNRPTRQVGGDYYTCLALPEGRLGLVVADVTGKGMPAALLVSTLHSALRLLLDSEEPGAALLSRLNQHIAESSASNKFITLILAELDPRTGRLGFLNAGHNPGLLIRRDGRVEQLAPSGLPLGLLPGSEYRYDQQQLESGDLLCLYSDGITECASRSDEEFGMERLTEFLVARRGEPLVKILEGLELSVTRFADGQPQGDDQTVVLLRRSHAPGAGH